MEVIINLNFENNIDRINYDFELGVEANTFDMIVTAALEEKFESIVNINELLISDLENNLMVYKSMFEKEQEDKELEKFINTLEKILVGKYDLSSNIKEIIMSGDYNKIIYYIENNPILKNKRIIINERFNLDKEKLLELKKVFNDYPNIYINIVGNRESVSIDDCLKTINAIDSLVEEIKKYNYSPLEQLMYAYDLVRDRIYTAELDGESPLASRDLSSVILGDKIVCAGYANIFDKVVNKLGMRTSIYDIDCTDGKTGHSRNIVYIKDEKYDVDGVYYFDTTWDSKKNEVDNEFLNHFRFFAKTKKEIEVYQKGMYIDKNLPQYSEELKFIIEEYIEEGKTNKIPVNVLRTINKMSDYIDGGNLHIDTTKFLINETFGSNIPIVLEIDEEELISKVEEYVYLFDKPIKAETLLKVLYQVRKNEYYNNCNKYPFSINDFFKTVTYSDWKFYSTGKDFLLEMIFDCYKLPKEKLREKMIEYSKCNHLGENIESVKLTKTLRKVLDKKYERN